MKKLVKGVLGLYALLVAAGFGYKIGYNAKADPVERPEQVVEGVAEMNIGISGIHRDDDMKVVRIQFQRSDKTGPELNADFTLQDALAHAGNIVEVAMAMGEE